jgi:uncharacterized membrane protein
MWAFDLLYGDIIMSKKNNTKANNRAAKKAAVLDQPKRGIKPLALAIMMMVVGRAMVIGYSLTAGQKPEKPAEIQNTTVSAVADSTMVSYPTTMFEDAIARYFEYRTGDLTIRFFVLKSSDGVLRAAFDACDVCWPEGKGYVQGSCFKAFTLCRI